MHSTIKELDLIDIYRILRQTAAEYTFFPSSHGIHTKAALTTGHNTYLYKIKRIETIQSMFLEDNEIKLASITERYLNNIFYLVIKQLTSKYHMGQRISLNRN